MVETIANLKKLIRSEVKARRAALTEDEKQMASLGFLEQLKLLVLAREAKTISCFFPVRGEPNTVAFLQWAIENNIAVLLPSSREDGLLDWVKYDGGEVQPGLFGIPEPIGEALSPLAVSEVDLMLIPASAVDNHGNRLGWGLGFFDKSLASMSNKPPVFAVVYDSEIVETVPTEPHDAKIFGAVTPTRVIYFD